MSAAITLTPEEALKAIADAPDSAEKTPADLRKAADDFEGQAGRKDRLAVTRVNGNRRAARAKATQRKGDQLRLHAQVCRRRKSLTVGEATKSAVVRAMRRALRHGGGES
jgi:hypothetical protein